MVPSNIEAKVYIPPVTHKNAHALRHRQLGQRRKGRHSPWPRDIHILMQTDRQNQTTSGAQTPAEVY